MQKKQYKVGSNLTSWQEGSAQSITFIVTEDCNLRCKYCYITHKSSDKILDYGTAVKFIDYLLSFNNKSEAVILEFIGGEPLLEIELIDKICDYFKQKTYSLEDEWYWNYKISISTNGVNYSDKKVQDFLEKNTGKVSIAITLDGNKEKHDLQRVFPTGEGSYEIVKKNVELWLKDFPGNTKVTFASEDLPLLKDSIIELWKDGIKDVAANVVFEDVWKDNDDKIFEEQLKSLADYVLDNDLYDKYICTLFDDSIGQPYTEQDFEQTSCGAGKMIALGTDGNLYPCVRYYDYSLNKKKGYIIGNVDEGIDKEKLRVFGALRNKYQSDSECLSCDVATGCMFCQGFNYDESETNTNFQRSKYICKMHKARVRANNYYFAKLKNTKGIEREFNMRIKKKLLFILSDDYVSFCSNKNTGNIQSAMDMESIKKGLEFAEQNFMKPVFLHSANSVSVNYTADFDEYDILHIISAKEYKSIKNNIDYLLVFDKESVENNISKQRNIILNVEQEEINYLYKYTKKLMEVAERININIIGFDSKMDISIYEEQLRCIADEIANKWEKEGAFKEINILTDIMFLNKHEPCGCGESLIAYAPNNKFYLCPAYYSNKKDCIGNINEGFQIKNKHLFTKAFAPLCGVCDAYQCEYCIFTNQKSTLEVNVSPSYQCKKSIAERRVSVLLQERLSEHIDFRNKLEEIDFNDPYEKLCPTEEKIGLYYH